MLKKLFTAVLSVALAAAFMVVVPGCGSKTPTDLGQKGGQKDTPAKKKQREERASDEPARKGEEPK